MSHRTDSKQYSRRAVAVPGGMYEKFFRVEFVDAHNFFVGVDVEIVIEHKVNVMRQQLFARRFLAARLQGSLMHLQLIWRGEEREADGIQTDGVSNRAFLEDEITQTFLRGCISARETCRASADD